MQLDALPPMTRDLYEYAAGCDELEKFTLVGGSALALQIGHRQSLDLDFAVFDESLPGRHIDRWIERARADGLSANDLTDIEAASRFRINTGLALSRFARDYEIAGVKVTFFAHGKTEAQRRYYRKADVLRSRLRSFAVLGIEGLKVAKTLVLADRARSRDLFDLMVLMRDHGLSVDRMVEIVHALGHNNDIEHYLAVMTGDLPLDEADQGLTPTGGTVSLEAIYAFMREHVDQWQVERASKANWPTNDKRGHTGRLTLQCRMTAAPALALRQ